MWCFGRSRAAAVTAAICSTFGALLPWSEASAPYECNGASDTQCVSSDDIVTSLIQMAPPAVDKSIIMKSRSSVEKHHASDPRVHTVPLAQSVHDYEALDVGQSFMNLQNVVQNNLGGAGPDSGAEEIVYENVYVLPNATVDLVVTATTPYNPRNAKDNNGVNGAVGAINMAGGENTTFLFKFVDSSNHSKPVTLKTLYMSFYDLDNDRKGLREVISSPFFEHVFLYEDTAIETIARHGDQPPVFASTGVDYTGATNPEDPASLTPEQKARTLTFSYLLVSEVEITFATWNGQANSGRNFFFNGVPMFPECINKTETAGLTFTETTYSNFGGQGPDFGGPEGMRFKNVFQLDSGAYVDLRVNNTDGDGFEYVASNKPEKNGARDGFGCINMEVGAKAKFTFEFIDSETDAPVTMKNLEFSYLDFDGHPKMANFKEVVITGGFQDIYMTEDSNVDVEFLADGTTKFSSTVVDTNGGASNPDNPTSLTPEQERRSVTLKYDSVQTFTAIIDISSGSRKMPRSIYFIGTSRLSNGEDEEYCE